MAQTIDDLRIALNDPDFGVGFIIANNPEDVADRLRSAGWVASDTEGILTALNGMLDAGNYSGFQQALSVPVRTDRLTAEELAVVTEQAVALANVGGQPLAKNSQGGFNVGALFAGLATGYTAYLQATGQQQVQPGQQAGQQAGQQQQPPRDNTMTIVLVILVVVAIVVAIALFAKKK